MKKRILPLLLAGLLLLAPWAAAAEAPSAVPSADAAQSEPADAPESVSQASSVIEFINTHPVTPPPDPTENRSFPIGLLAWGAILVLAVLLVLFLHETRGRNRYANPTARSRWQRHAPVRTGTSEKINRERSRTRK